MDNHTREDAQYQQITGMSTQTTQQEQTFIEQLHDEGPQTVEQDQYREKNPGMSQAVAISQPHEVSFYLLLVQVSLMEANNIFEHHKLVE